MALVVLTGQVYILYKYMCISMYVFMQYIYIVVCIGFLPVTRTRYVPCSPAKIRDTVVKMLFAYLSVEESSSKGCYFPRILLVICSVARLYPPGN